MSLLGDVLEQEQVADKRRLVVNTAIALAVSEHKIPTPEGLARKSGLTIEEITALFPTLDELGSEIRTIAAEMYQDLDNAMPASSSLRTMLNELVDLRARLYETAGDIRALGDAAEQFLPSIAQAKAIREGRYRAALAATFSQHFEDPNDPFYGQLELITSWESWRHLRIVQCLSESQAKYLIRRLLNAVASSAL